MLNKVQLIGRLGKDPVIKTFANDGAVADFPLATTDVYKDKEGKWVEVTDWHNVVLPNKALADRAERYLKKGSMVYIEGKIKTRSWETEGVKKYITEVRVDNLRMLDKKDSGSSSEPARVEDTGAMQQHDRPPMVEHATLSGDDDLPF